MHAKECGNMTNKVIFGIVMLSLLFFPIIGSKVYFRHDDASFIDWAANFSGTYMDVFSRDGDINGTAGMPGMGYYRPGIYIVALMLVRSIGPVPQILMGLAGLAMATALAVYMLVIKKMTSYMTSTFTILTLILLYSNLLYQAFRFLVPFTYLIQVSAVYALIIAISTNEQTIKKILLFVASTILYLWSASRQSSIVLVPVITILWLLYYKEQNKYSIMKRVIYWSYIIILGVMLSSIILYRSGYLTSLGTIAVLLDHITIRFDYYWSVAMENPRLVILSALMTYMIIKSEISKVVSIRQMRYRLLARTTASLILLSIVITSGTLSSLSFLLLSALAISANPKLIAALIWFWTGLVIYLIPQFYHQAYLLESILGLCFAFGICFGDIMRDFPNNANIDEVLKKSGSRIKLIMTVSILAFVLIIILGSRIVNTITSKYDAINAFVNANKSTLLMVDYVTNELPNHSRLMMLSIAQLNMSSESWRHEDLMFRAVSVRVLDTNNLRSMLSAIGTNIIVDEYMPPEECDTSIPVYGVIFSENEYSVFQKDWDLIEIEDLSIGITICKIVLLEIDNE